MIKLSKDMEAYILEKKVNKLLQNRDHPKFIGSRLIPLKGLIKNWLPAENPEWQEDIVIAYTVFFERPFKIGEVEVNLYKSHYQFNTLFLINNKQPLSIEQFPIRKKLWGLLARLGLVVGAKFAIDLNEKDIKFAKVIDVAIHSNDLEIYPERQHELNFVKANLNLIEFNPKDIADCFIRSHLLTHEYRVDGGLGKIGTKNSNVIGWSLYKLV